MPLQAGGLNQTDRTLESLRTLLESRSEVTEDPERLAAYLDYDDAALRQCCNHYEQEIADIECASDELQGRLQRNTAIQELDLELARIECRIGRLESAEEPEHWIADEAGELSVLRAQQERLAARRDSMGHEVRVELRVLSSRRDVVENHLETVRAAEQVAARVTRDRILAFMDRPWCGCPDRIDPSSPSPERGKEREYPWRPRPGRPRPPSEPGDGPGAPSLRSSPVSGRALVEAAVSVADELGSEVPDSFAKLEGDGTEEWSEYHDWAMAALVESAAHSGDQQWTTQLFWVYAPDWLGADRFSVFKCRHGEFPAGRHGVLPTLVAQPPQLASAAAAVRSLRKEPDALGFVLVERGYGARVELDVPTLLWFQGGAEWPTEEVRADWPYLPFMVAWAHDITTGWKAQLIRAHSSNGRPLPGSVLDYNSHKIFSYAPDAWAPHLGWRPVLSRNN